MGFFDSLFGRTKPPSADLDALFALPSAAITLEAAAGIRPTGIGAVCYRQSEGAAFHDTQRDVTELLDADQGPKVERTVDDFGFTWLLCRHDAGDVGGLVTDLHAINTALTDNGFGPQLLCSTVAFTTADGAPFALVYLYKRGTFYPFAPTGPNRRDNALELQVRGIVGDDLRIESDLGRWLAVWGAPGLG
ncbi:hypothetical protein CLV56_0286 [Mumia flava]|uniref:Uncharacterized protein n=1 Tax=Mumia flava TaxID=1348852 RepID=A0A0B2AY03_9ACTN|nr:hypothetical protein [Mumia flava]PJJ56082.1 hypothetical protein CLV56_0286 [Mumia flava]